MEPDTEALETVCRYYKVEFGSQALQRLRINNRVLGRQNASLRRELTVLKSEQNIRRELAQIWARFLLSHVHRLEESIIDSIQ